MAMEEFSTRQNAEILQLNRLVQQYRHERECNSIIGQLQQDKIARLENLMDGVLTADDFVDEELKSLADKHEELDSERECSKELKEAMQMAMEGHAHMLEQYADLEEKHINMLINKRRIQDGIEDVKKAAVRAGVKGAESRFINALANEISSLKVEREKERRRFRDENKGLREQLRDTAEAVQVAGELVVRLKDAEEAVAAAYWRSSS